MPVPALALLVLIALVSQGCAGKPVPIEVKASEEAPREVRASRRTKPLRIVIRADERPERSIKQTVRVDRSLRGMPGDTPKAELSDLPITLPVEQKSPEVLVLEFPPNVVQLLAQSGRSAVYSGTLTTDEGGGKEIPLEIVIQQGPRRRQEPGKPKPSGVRPQIKSAG